MRTVDNPASEKQNRWQKLRNDTALLIRFGAMILYYLTKGRQLRRIYRACEDRGEVFWVDDDPAESERRLR